MRISHLDNNDAVGVIASRLRHLHYLRQGVLRPRLAALIETPLQELRGSAIRNLGGSILRHDPKFQP
ncbi:MAG: hypothetical protein NTZ08_04780 [Verrucomicrobia bacterium]|nr:hypothetical protein [Verrucomicrobiota bacterium]